MMDTNNLSNVPVPPSRSPKTGLDMQSIPDTPSSQRHMEEQSQERQSSGRVTSVKPSPYLKNFRRPDLFDESVLSDVRLNVGGRFIKAHRSVLAVGGCYFWCRFAISSSCSVQDLQNFQLPKHPDDFELWYLLISLMYGTTKYNKSNLLNLKLNNCIKFLACVHSVLSDPVREMVDDRIVELLDQAVAALKKNQNVEASLDEFCLVTRQVYELKIHLTPTIRSRLAEHYLETIPDWIIDKRQIREIFRDVPYLIVDLILKSRSGTVKD